MKIWFVPSNSSHVGKFRPLMDAMRDRGDDVRIIDVDAAHPAVLAARRQIQGSGYSFEVLPPSAYDPDAHWLRQATQHRHIERAFGAVLDRIEADALVFGYDSFVSGRAFVRVGRRRGMATFLIPDGLVVAPNDRFRQSGTERARDALALALQRLFRAGGPRGLSGVDGILVINAMGGDVLAEQGVPPETVHVVGSPEYDLLAQRLRGGPDPEEGRALRRRLGLPADRAVVLFAHQVLDGAERELVRTMASAVRRCGAVLLTKFHPRGGDRTEEWRAWADHAGLGFPDTMFVSTECTTIEALGIAAACVTAYSTVSLEAFVYDCPLILIQYANVPYALPYGRRYGAALDVCSPDELEAAILAAVGDADVRQRLHDGRNRAIAGELGGLDGGSADRMMAAIDETVARLAGAVPAHHGPAAEVDRSHGNRVR